MIHQGTFSVPVLPLHPFSSRRFGVRLLFTAVLLLACVPGVRLLAQNGGEAGITGTVVDPTGAAVAKATVTAVSDATGVPTTRETDGSGLYNISPIVPGKYTVTVKASGFKEFVQKNLTLDALNTTALNVTLTIGSESSEVTVSEAPPALETTNATIGITMENETYSNLPLVTNAAMRDPTAFAALAPGTQGGARLPLVGGTGNYLGQLYLDGLPAETINQQADNRVVSQAVSVDAVDQFQEVTSTPPVQFSGAGATNFSMKSGSLKYHGQVSDFIRNTLFDLNGFANKATTVTNASGAKVFAPKPVDHQNEFSASIGGHVPFTNRLFFFAAYDRFHNRSATNPAQYTIPTAQMRTGDFSQLACLQLATAQQANCIATGGPVGNGVFGTDANGNPVSNGPLLFDPTTNTCVGTACSRTGFSATKGGVVTNNVIPSNYLSPFALKAQQYLPDVSANNTLNLNYTGLISNGFDNHAIDWRVDFDMTPRQRISTVGAMGAVNYLNNYGAPYLPQPYTGGDLAAIFPKVYDVEHTWTISNSIVNQLKFGYVRFYMDIADSTDGVSTYSPTSLGLTNLPAGQAGREFPGMSFASNTKFASAAITTWTGNGAAVSTQITTPNNFTLLDNFQYTKGAHNINAGISIQWQEINNANPATLTGFLSLPFSANSTANYSGSSISNSSTGYAYASFLLGAVSQTSLSVQPLAETGGRYLPIAPFIEDTWKINSKVTLDAGLRWDYLPPFHEVLDRWSFLNPNITNPATGTLGALQFAGNYGGSGVSCNCRTPVQTYWKNFGPRVGITYAMTPTTVWRVGIGHVFSQGGGVGGRVGAANGTGGLGFNTTATSPTEVTSGVSAGPSYYLNNSSYFQAIGKANTGLFNGQAYPTAPVPGAASVILNTGNYVGGPAAGGAPGYADPYFSGRSPDFTFYNIGVQQALTNSLTLAINYVGNQSHHLYNSTAGGANIRGYWANQLNPIYLAALAGTVATDGKTPVLSAPASAANIAIAQSKVPGLSIPAFYAAYAAAGGSTTITQGLVAFPQYSGTSDTWGVNTANFSYNSLQVTVDQRNWKGMTYAFNYTWSKNIGDDGTFRSGFDIPSNAISLGTQSYHMDRIERADTTVSQRHVMHAYGVYRLPIGTGILGGQNAVSRQILGGWQLGGIVTFFSGTPVLVTGATCSIPGQGQCMPDINPAYTGGNPRINGGYGRGLDGRRTACNIGLGTVDGTLNGTPCSAGTTGVKYLDCSAFSPARGVGGANIYTVAVTPAALGPGCVQTASITSQNQLLGNAPRVSPYGLRNPNATNLDMSIKRTFKIHEAMNLQLEADCVNVANHTIFGSPNASYGNAAFGTVSGVSNKPRSFQIAGHFNF